MRAVASDPVSDRSNGAAAAAFIKASFSVRAIGKRYVSRLQQLEQYITKLARRPNTRLPTTLNRTGARSSFYSDLTNSFSVMSSRTSSGRENAVAQPRSGRIISEENA